MTKGGITGNPKADKAINKLSREYPELFIGKTDTPIYEHVKAAYEVDAIIAQKKYNRLVTVATIALAIFAAFSIFQTAFMWSGQNRFNVELIKLNEKLVEATKQLSYKTPAIATHFSEENANFYYNQEYYFGNIFVKNIGGVPLILESNYKIYLKCSDGFKEEAGYAELDTETFGSSLVLRMEDYRVYNYKARAEVLRRTVDKDCNYFVNITTDEPTVSKIITMKSNIIKPSN